MHRGKLSGQSHPLIGLKALVRHSETKSSRIGNNLGSRTSISIRSNADNSLEGVIQNSLPGTPCVMQRHTFKNMQDSHRSSLKTRLSKAKWQEADIAQNFESLLDIAPKNAARSTSNRSILTHSRPASQQLARRPQPIAEEHKPVSNLNKIRIQKSISARILHKFDTPALKEPQQNSSGQESHLINAENGHNHSSTTIYKNSSIVEDQASYSDSNDQPKSDTLECSKSSGKQTEQNQSMRSSLGLSSDKHTNSRTAEEDSCKVFFFDKKEPKRPEPTQPEAQPRAPELFKCNQKAMPAPQFHQLPLQANDSLLVQKSSQPPIKEAVMLTPLPPLT